METQIKLDIKDFSELETLRANYENWGEDYKKYLDSDGKEGQTFSWRRNCHTPIKNYLKNINQEHCSFCDVFPFDSSKETIEHFRPKNEYPLQAYKISNLFYCCDKCQSCSNKPYVSNIKPDHSGYQFDDLFYIDLEYFEVKVIESLETDNIQLFIKAKAFLDRYCINSMDRITRRKSIYRDLKNYKMLEYGQPNARLRDEFAFRYMYDLIIVSN